MNAYGNNDYYLHTSVDKLALAVTEPAPFRVEVEEPKSALVQNGEMALKFKVRRDKGFDGPVTVQMEWRPTGVNTATPVTVRAGQTEGTYLLGAARNAVGRRPPGHADRHERRRAGAATTTARAAPTSPSQPFQLTVAEPHVEARIARTSIERGKTATLVCKLNHLQPFDGQGEGDAGPPAARRRTGRADARDHRGRQGSDASRCGPRRRRLVGNYQGVVLDLTVIDNGQSVRQLSGYGMLRVDRRERGPRNAEASRPGRETRP